MRPDRVAGHLVAVREREEVERPLVPVHGLRRLPGLDADDLREVELERGRVAEHRADRARDRRVHHEVVRGRGAGDEPAGAPGVVAAEVVGRRASPP